MGADIRKMGALRDPDETALEAELARACFPLSRPPAPVQPARQRLQNLMWDEVGVMRTAAGLKRGLLGLKEMREEVAEIGVASDMLAFNLTWHDWLNMASLVDISEVITQAALARDNSRGAHYREDFPDPGAMDDSYFTVVRQLGDKLDVTREEVAFTIVKPGETVLPEGAPETLVAAQ